MNKPKKIILFTIGNVDNASSRIRGIFYIPLFEKHGYEINWIPRVPPQPKTGFRKYFCFPVMKRFLSMQRFFHLLFSKPDVFLIQKIFVPQWLLKNAKRKGITIIYDYDDAVFLDKNDNKAKEKLIDILKVADKIIVSTPVLKSYTEKYNKNVEIITTPVDTAAVKQKTEFHKEDAFVIGWTGSPWTTKYLEIIKQPLKKLSESHRIKLRLVGADKSFNIDGVDIEHINWSLDSENEILSTFDVGIMPLTNDDYSKAKGGYKLLLYMAAGIPSVASPVGINKEIVVEGKTGFLAENDIEWEKSIEFFIQNRQNCITFGDNSRKQAEKKYSREICFEKLKEIVG
jgi:glycosyltransferase involved in cell wall biosynthesis